MIYESLPFEKHGDFHSYARSPEGPITLFVSPFLAHPHDWAGSQAARRGSGLLHLWCVGMALVLSPDSPIYASYKQLQ